MIIIVIYHWIINYTSHDVSKVLLVLVVELDASFENPNIFVLYGRSIMLVFIYLRFAKRPWRQVIDKQDLVPMV